MEGIQKVRHEDEETKSTAFPDFNQKLCFWIEGSTPRS